MAKERPEKKEKKDRKEKKEKRSETDGVKKSKKEKKDKKVIVEENDSSPVPEPAPVESKPEQMEDVEMEDKPRVVIPKEALVPFANPLADDKQTKKLLRTVKKAAKNKTLKRGVKEVVKSVRKMEINAPASSTISNPPGIVILAADISPMDVISHIPVLCEDHNIPYIYVTSRAELGAAGNTKRPTSVVMISRERQKKKDGSVEEGQEEYKETYTELLKLVQKAGATLRI